MLTRIVVAAAVAIGGLTLAKPASAQYYRHGYYHSYGPRFIGPRFVGPRFHGPGFYRRPHYYYGPRVYYGPPPGYYRGPYGY